MSERIRKALHLFEKVLGPRGNGIGEASFTRECYEALAAAQADLTKPVWRRVEEMPEGRIWAWFRIAGMKTGEPKNWSKKDALEYGASLFSSCECPPPPPQEGD